MNNKNCLSITSFLFFISFTSFGNSFNFFNVEPEMIIDNHHCAKSIQKVIYETWQADRRWQKMMTDSLEKIAFKSPTINSKKWVNVVADKTIFRAILHDQEKSMIIDWDNKCKKTVSHRQNKPQRVVGMNTFSDKDISNLVSKNETGIIYIWAPEMPYSVKGIKEIKKAAAKMNSNLTVLLSPVSDYKFAKEIAKKENLGDMVLKRHRSNQLHLRGIDLHYPSIITYRDKKLNRYARHGYEPEKFFTAYLLEEFSK